MLHRRVGMLRGLCKPCLDFYKTLRSSSATAGTCRMHPAAGTKNTLTQSSYLSLVNMRP